MTPKPRCDSFFASGVTNRFRLKFSPIGGQEHPISVYCYYKSEQQQNPFTLENRDVVFAAIPVKDAEILVYYDYEAA